MKFKIKLSLRLSLLGIVIPFMIGCSNHSNHLSREAATKAIIEKENLPLKVTKQFRFVQDGRFYSRIPYTENLWNKFSHTIQLDANDIIQLDKNDFNYFATPEVNRELFEIYEKLEREGLVKYSVAIDNVYIAGAPTPGTKDNFPIEGSIIHNANLTEKGKVYLISEDNVEVATIEFGEITGIVERKEFNTAEVNYTLKRTKVTPFERIAFDLTEETMNRNVTFTKYDDGWRIGN